MTRRMKADLEHKSHHEFSEGESQENQLLEVSEAKEEENREFFN